MTLKTLDIENVEELVSSIVAFKEEGQYNLITSTKLHQMIDEDTELLLIDSMTEELYNKRHIKGAINFEGSFSDNIDFPKNKLEDLKILLESNQKENIVIYSSRMDCRRSHVIAKWIVKLGYKNVYKLIGGTLSWRERGFDFIKEKD